jgi:hypothetical protein
MGKDYLFGRIFGRAVGGNNGIQMDWYLIFPEK